MAEELTLNLAPVSGAYTRLTRFFPGSDTTPFGGKSHQYPEEIFIVSGCAKYSRPPGELHGPFKTDNGCVILEVSFPNKLS